MLGQRVAVLGEDVHPAVLLPARTISTNEDDIVLDLAELLRVPVFDHA